MTDIKSMTLEELTAWLKSQGEPGFRAKQIFRWIYRGVTSFDEMTDLSKSLREKLKEAGIRITVLSNKPHAQAVDVVETLFGKGYFDAVQGQTDSVPRKPSPIGANRLAELFQAEKKDCLYIGDTATDMETGKAAEMETAGVLWGFRDRKELEESKACHIAAKPEELFYLAAEKENNG